ncbi:hypothetical protein V2J09_022630 [Rumex salicifolius]
MSSIERIGISSFLPLIACLPRILLFSLIWRDSRIRKRCTGCKSPMFRGFKRGNVILCSFTPLPLLGESAIEFSRSRMTVIVGSRMTPPLSNWPLLISGISMISVLMSVFPSELPMGYFLASLMTLGACYSPPCLRRRFWVLCGVWGLLRSLDLMVFNLCWKMVGPNVVSSVLVFFASSKLPSGLNDTLISLITKVDSLERISQFRPINLCNIALKIITKVMVACLQLILGDLIGPMLDVDRGLVSRSGWCVGFKSRMIWGLIWVFPYFVGGWIGVLFSPSWTGSNRVVLPSLTPSSPQYLFILWPRFRPWSRCVRISTVSLGRLFEVVQMASANSIWLDGRKFANLSVMGGLGAWGQVYGGYKQGPFGQALLAADHECLEVSISVLLFLLTLTLCGLERCMWEVITRGAKWNLGNGTSIRFWLDHWIGDSKLIDIATSPVGDDILHVVVQDFWRTDGGWDWSDSLHLG